MINQAFQWIMWSTSLIPHSMILHAMILLVVMMDFKLLSVTYTLKIQKVANFGDNLRCIDWLSKVLWLKVLNKFTSQKHAVLGMATQVLYGLEFILIF